MESTKPDQVLRYKADASRTGLMIVAALAPVWALWMPWVVSWLAIAVIQDQLSSSTWDLLVLMLFFITIIMAAVATVFVCLDNKLVIGERGIKIPIRFLVQTWGRAKFKWTDLDSLVFEKNRSPSVHPEELCFYFGGKTRTPLNISGLAREDIPRILMAIQAYAPKTSVLPEEQATIGMNGSSVTSPASFTKIWEEELNNRFGSTIFVPLEPGNQLQDGRIKVVGQIAFGGLSAIYLAKLPDEKLVVIKEAVVPQNADETSKAKALEMFAREAALLITLDHERVAHVLDHFMEGGRNYLLLEYIEGKDLRTYVKENGPAPEEVVARWSSEIASILDYLHSMKPPIIHRDLTPDNLVLAKDGSISLIDFGAANEFMGTATGTLVGKQSYISPEQFRGKALPESDLYSLGCTLQFLLTGKDPEPLAMSHPKELKPSTSDAMNTLVAKLTEQEVEDRIRYASDVVAQSDAMVESIRLKQEVAHHA